LSKPFSRPPFVRVSIIIAGACATGVCLFGHLGAIGLVGPDEPRYAWIARAMAETGDWVTPRLYGQPWFEKPVLYYWAAAIGFRAHLSPEWATRLPSAIAALAAAFAIGWLGWKFFLRSENLAETPAFLSPLLFSTSVGAIGFARAAGPDMLFASTLTVAMAAAASVLRQAGALGRAEPPAPEKPRSDIAFLLLFGASLGLAALAKGPAAVVLAAGAIGCWSLTTKHWRAAFRLAHPIAFAAFGVVALPWYILCEVRNTEFIRVFIFQHNFERYLTPVFQHRQPVWFFLPIIILGLLPWTPLLIPAALEGVRLWREKSWTDSPGYFFAWWAFVPFLFFSFSQSKLPGYILPAIPPLALLCSIGAIRVFQRGRMQATALAGAIGCMWLALILAAIHFARRVPAVGRDGAGPQDPFRPLLLPALALAILILLVSAFAGYLRKLGVVVLLSALAAGIAVEAASARVLPTVDELYSARRCADFLRHDRRPDRLFIYRLKRAEEFGLAFYFGRRFPEWPPADAGAALVLTNPQGFVEIKKLGRISGPLDEPNAGILLVPISPARAPGTAVP
jgi:4-amino-4-deoxy-L-arabinose transferase-like glycosyltransferase